MKKVAFFDIDGTVFRSSLLVRLVEELVAVQVFPKNAAVSYEQAFTAWRSREGSYEAYIAAVIEAFLLHIKGIQYGTVADIGRLVVDEHQKEVYRYTRDLIPKLKSEGYVLIAISQSPKFILDAFCHAYGFDKVYGRMYEIGPTDRFTGEVIDEHIIENKANIVRRVCESIETDISEAIAVGDTDGDIPMLELVGKPICFNPNQELYTYAKNMQWPIVVERKDVVYEL